MKSRFTQMTKSSTNSNLFSSCGSIVLGVPSKFISVHFTSLVKYLGVQGLLSAVLCLCSPRCRSSSLCLCSVASSMFPSFSDLVTCCHNRLQVKHTTVKVSHVWHHSHNKVGSNEFFHLDSVLPCFSTGRSFFLVTGSLAVSITLVSPLL